ncbi:MAG: GTP cyclohydrolase II, partial [Maritimibacter sp.]
MPLHPDAKELAARARADLRVGVPVVRGIDGVAALVASAETLSAARLEALRSVGPADDLMAPMKGPLATERGGAEQVARAAIALTKAAHLRPAALLVPVADGAAEAAAHGLTWLDLTGVDDLGEIGVLTEGSAARVPMQVSQAGRLHIYRPGDGTEE